MCVVVSSEIFFSEGFCFLKVDFVFTLNHLIDNARLMKTPRERLKIDVFCYFLRFRKFFRIKLEPDYGTPWKLAKLRTLNTKPALRVWYLKGLCIDFFFSKRYAFYRKRISGFKQWQLAVTGRFYLCVACDCIPFGLQNFQKMEVLQSKSHNKQRSFSLFFFSNLLIFNNSRDCESCIVENQDVQSEICDETTIVFLFVAVPKRLCKNFANNESKQTPRQQKQEKWYFRNEFQRLSTNFSKNEF